MARHHSVSHRIGELVLVVFIAVGVVGAGAAVREALRGTSPVEAGDLTFSELAASVAPDGGSQVLSPSGWDVTLTMPYTAEMGKVVYAFHDTTSIGLSTSNLTALGPECSAARNGLGTLVRFTRGSWHSATQGDTSYHLIASLNGYDYGYRAPLNACTDDPEAQSIVNRQYAVVLESLATQPLR